MPDPTLVNARVPAPSERVPKKLFRPVLFTPAAAAARVYGARFALLLPPIESVTVPAAFVVTVPLPARPSMVSLVPFRSRTPFTAPPSTTTLLASEI